MAPYVIGEPFDVQSKGFFILHHGGESRAEALGFNAKTAGLGLPGTPN